MMSRVDDAVLALYEDARLREDLTDEEAAALYAWAKARLHALHAAAADDDAFQAAVSKVRGLFSSLNRVVGQRAYVTPEEHAAQLGKVGLIAQQLGMNAPTEPLLAQGADDSAAYLASLLSQIDGSAVTPTSSPAETTSTPENDEWTDIE
jgi:hypothetical protein